MGRLRFELRTSRLKEGCSCPQTPASTRGTIKSPTKSHTTQPGQVKQGECTRDSGHSQQGHAVKTPKRAPAGPDSVAEEEAPVRQWSRRSTVGRDGSLHVSHPERPPDGAGRGRRPRQIHHKHPASSGGSHCSELEPSGIEPSEISRQACGAAGGGATQSKQHAVIHTAERQSKSTTQQRGEVTLPTLFCGCK